MSKVRGSGLIKYDIYFRGESFVVIKVDVDFLVWSIILNMLFSVIEVRDRFVD